MKKIMAIAIVTLLTGATSSWALFGLEDISYDGSLEVSGHSAKNEKDVNDSANDKRGGTNTRVRVGANLTVTDGVKGRLEFTRTGQQYGKGPNSLTTEEGQIFINNAFVDIEGLFGLKNVRVGKQYVGEPGDLVWNISPTDDDSLSVNSIDGILLESSWVDNLLDINVFTGKASDDDSLTSADNTHGTAAGALSGSITGDVNLTNVEVFINIIPGGRINLGLLSGSADVTSTTGSGKSDDRKLRTYRLGVRGAVSEGMFTYRAEVLQNAGSGNNLGNNPAGTEEDFGGAAIDLGGGVNFGEEGSDQFGIEVNFMAASGDDDTTDNDDDSFHDFTPLGINTSDRLWGEIFGKSNSLSPTPLGQGPDFGLEGQGLQVIHLGGSYEPSWFEKGSVQIDFFQFSRTEDTVRTGATTVVNMGDDFGTEIDLTFGYDHSENVAILFGYAMLNPDDALTGVGAVNDDAITKWFARGKIKWGGEEE